MKKIFISLVSVLILLPTTLMAQEKYLDQISVDGVQIRRDGADVILDMNIVLDDLNIRSNDVILLSPVLKMKKTGEVMKVLPTIQIAGRKRAIVLERMADTGIARAWEVKPEMEYRRHNGKVQSIRYTQKMMSENWMSDAELLFAEVVYGCANCMELEGAKVLRESFIYPPNFHLTYIVPEVEPVKSRADRHTASFNFKVSSDILIHDYKNNAIEFDKVDRVVSDALKNKDITLTDFAVLGYASPEGNFEENRSLASRRANSFAEYLKEVLRVKASQFKVSGIGEDWKGLESAIAQSTIPTRDKVLEIIRTTDNPDARDAKIFAIDEGVTYNHLLKVIYPSLRRTDYVLAYTVRGFNVEEAKEIIKKNPKLLSLNEMYLVAQTYDANSREFKEVFDIAVRMYPREPIAIINASAADIEGGNYQAAIQRLEKLTDNPNAINNLAIAYANLGEYAKAQMLFEKARDMGNPQALANINELNKNEKDHPVE